VERYTTTTDQLVDDFEPFDQVRAKVYRELIKVRQALIDTLSPEEWREDLQGLRLLVGREGCCGLLGEAHRLSLVPVARGT